MAIHFRELTDVGLLECINVFTSSHLAMILDYFKTIATRSGIRENFSELKQAIKTTRTNINLKGIIQLVLTYFAENCELIYIEVDVS